MQKNKYAIKSPLRYPGGKSKAIEKIEAMFPDNFCDFLEPFVGGGSMFLYVRQKYPKAKVWINDLNPEVYSFWKASQENLPGLVSVVREIKRKSSEGKKLYGELLNVNLDSLSLLARGARFFVLNRITFSGTVESGGYSEQAFRSRFTDSSIDRLESLEGLLDGVKVTNLDYQEILLQNCYFGDLFFLDPPYSIAEKSKLYGKNGSLHSGFDHRRLASVAIKCQGRVLMTYDDSPLIRHLFSEFSIKEWQMQYGMNNVGKSIASKGNEIFIRNF